MTLSVLVPSLMERDELLSRLLWHVLPQPGLNSDFEVVVNRRDLPLGEKINQLIGAASGSHIVLVADDDWIPGYYMSKVVPLLDRDVVGYRVAVMINGKYSRSQPHSPEFEGWGATNRCYAPQIPVRKTLVEGLVFGDEYAADREWSLSVEPRIGDYHYVDEELYVYDHWTERSGEWADARGVGRWPVAKHEVAWM